MYVFILNLFNLQHILIRYNRSVGFTSEHVWVCSSMCAGLVSCHALLLNINYLQLWRRVGGEDAGRKEGGEK